MKVLCTVFFASALAVIVSGCSGPPKTLSRTAVPPNYTYGQEPAKTKLADKGGIYDKHAKELQKMRLEHERKLVEIEYKAEEARVAREKGVSVPAASSPTAAPAKATPATKYAPPVYRGVPGLQQVRIVPGPQLMVPSQQVIVPRRVVVPMPFPPPNSGFGPIIAYSGYPYR